MHFFQIELARIESYGNHVDFVNLDSPDQIIDAI